MLLPWSLVAGLLGWACVCVWATLLVRLELQDRLALLIDEPLHVSHAPQPAPLPLSRDQVSKIGMHKQSSMMLHEMAYLLGPGAFATLDSHTHLQTDTRLTAIIQGLDASS